MVLQKWQNSGLQAKAPHDAPVSGKTFGEGLYTSDVFGNSWNYCLDWRRTGYQGSRYTMLCDVALGKVRTMD